MSLPHVQAVLFDAYGTLLWLDDPVAAIGRALDRAGTPNPPAAVGAAFQAEVAYYQAHQDEGHDRASLARLRRRCAQLLVDRLPNPPDVEVADDILARELPYVADPEATAVLRSLRERGVRLGVVSNWDCGLDAILHDLGLLALVDVVAASAVVGARKPDPAIFLRVLDALGVAPERAVHCGDRVDIDGTGARAAGVRPVMLSRDGVPIDGETTVASLAGLVALLG